MLRTILRHQACQAQLEKIGFISVEKSKRAISFIPCKTRMESCRQQNFSCIPNEALDIRSCQLLLSRDFSTSSPTAKDKEQKAPKKVGIIAKFKKMTKDYWYVLFPVHVATSVVWFGGFYIMLKSGVDIAGMLESIGTSERILDYLRNSEAGYYALSYACYKIATPVRYTVTVGGTTIAIAKLKDKGYLKSTKEIAEKMKGKTDDMKDKLKYEERKDMMEDKIDNIKDRVKDRTDDLKEKYEDRKDMVEDKIDNIKEKAVDKKDKLKENVEDVWEKFSKKKK